MTERFPPDKESNGFCGIVILYCRPLWPENLSKEFLKVFPVVYKIELCRVDNQERSGFVPKEEVVVCFVEVPNVLF